MKPILPENILNKMSPSDRKSIGQQTASEATQQGAEKAEEDQHKLFIQWLNLNNIQFIHASMKKKAKTLKPGWPDFSVFANGQAVFVEFKVHPNKESEDQVKVRKEMEASGCNCVVAYSVMDAINFVRALIPIL